MANPRLFPLGESFEGSIWSLALLEALYLIYTDRYLEKCFVCAYSPEILKQCGLTVCSAPYFVPFQERELLAVLSIVDENFAIQRSSKL
ncbi:MAG TPA: hypothetical protein PKD55_15655 [Bellilinea sp.]|nr:hypothetical protein [Bellilinea sp.]